MNRIVNDPFSFYRWERAWLPRHTPGTSDPDKGERRGEETIKEGMLDKTIL